MAARQSFHPPGKPMHAKQPIPAATRVGNVIFSSAISGMDRSTGQTPADAETQIRNAFENVKATVEAAGASIEAIGKVVVFLRDRDTREIVNKYWVAMFPDDHSRPVRHTVGAPANPDFAIQLEFIAVV